MKIAILALQGAFIEHEQMLERLGVETFEIRHLADWQQPMDGLILPGGESTAMMRVMKDDTVKRNAYGRQLGSFQTEYEVKGVGIVPMVFIRAPYIERYGNRVEVLSTLDGHVVAARQRNMLVCSFHPELTDDLRLHEYWLKEVVQQQH